MHKSQYSETNEYSMQVSHRLEKSSTAPVESNKPRSNLNKVPNVFISHKASILTGSYAVPVDAVGNYELNNGNEELYWDPASQEEDLKQQLKKLKVQEVFKENIQ